MHAFGPEKCDNAHIFNSTYSFFLNLVRDLQSSTSGLRGSLEGFVLNFYFLQALLALDDRSSDGHHSSEGLVSYFEI